MAKFGRDFARGFNPAFSRSLDRSAQNAQNIRSDRRADQRIRDKSKLEQESDIAEEEREQARIKEIITRSRKNSSLTPEAQKQFEIDLESGEEIGKARTSARKTDESIRNAAARRLQQIQDFKESSDISPIINSSIRDDVNIVFGTTGKDITSESLNNLLGADEISLRAEAGKDELRFGRDVKKTSAFTAQSQDIKRKEDVRIKDAQLERANREFKAEHGLDLEEFAQTKFEFAEKIKLEQEQFKLTQFESEVDLQKAKTAIAVAKTRMRSMLVKEKLAINKAGASSVSAPAFSLTGAKDPEKVRLKTNLLNASIQAAVDAEMRILFGNEPTQSIQTRNSRGRQESTNKNNTFQVEEFTVKRK